MNYVKKQNRYLLGGSIFVLFLLVSFIINTILFNNKMNQIEQQYISGNNRQLAEHMAFRLNSGTEFVTDFADTLSRMPEFLLTEELVERKENAIGLEEMIVVSVNEKKELSFLGGGEELKEWILEHDEIWKEPLASFMGKQQIVFSAPVIREGEANQIVLGLESYREMHFLIQDTDNWKYGIRVLADRVSGEVLMMEKGEEAFVSEAELPEILDEVRRNNYKQTIRYNERFVSSFLLDGTDWVQISIVSRNAMNREMRAYTSVYFILILIEFLVLAVVLYGLRKDMQKKTQLFMKDSLTGGYNREGFLRMGQKYKEQNGKEKYSIVCLNISDFRHINELWGDDTGNKVLKFVYRVLEEKTNEKELVCRSGMDHFLILLHEGEEEKISARVKAIIDEINGRIHEKFSGYNMEFTIGCCQLSMEEEVERAIGKGIYVQKQEEEKNVCKFFNAEIAKKITEEQEINELFEGSLRNHDFKIYFQPKVSSEKGCQAEALVRWVHPKKGMIYPDQFIPLFERNGKIYELDLYVFEEVCKIVSLWRKQGKDVMEVSVNVSRFTLLNAGTEIGEKYRSIKEKYEIPDGMIEVELTETIMVDESQIAYIQKLLKGFHSSGLKVALDDFGFAYSSLSLLKAFDVDTIKLDRRFFVDENQKSRKIVANTIQLAHSLGMCVVAEGIEEEAQVDVLQESGCDFIQGYVYSRPIPHENFDLWKKEYEEQKKSRLN